MADLKKADFDPHINTAFEVLPTGLDKGVPIELVEIGERNSVHAECFSLIFRGPPGTVFNHDTHRVRHGRLGEFKLFIGPIQHPGEDGIYYEAVFNRMKEK